MHQDNKILISAVLILGVALVAFNFGGLSGRASYSDITDCQPLEISASIQGNKLTVTLTESEGGLRGTDYNGLEAPYKVDLRRDNGAKFRQQNIPRLNVQELDKTGYTQFSFVLSETDRENFKSGGSVSVDEKCVGSVMGKV